MKYLLKAADNYELTGFLMWSPGRNRWYPISQVYVEPAEMRSKIIDFIGEYLHEHFKVLPIDGYYDQIKKRLHIKRILPVAEARDQKIIDIRTDDEIQEDMMMYSEDIFILEDL